MILPDTPAKVLATLLVAGGFGNWPEASPVWNMGIDKLPDVPDQNMAICYIAVLNRRADQNSVKMRTGDRSEFWGWQILVRGETDNEDSPTDAAKKAAAIADYFDSRYLASASIGPTTYTIQRIRRSAQPLFLKQEERCNMRIWTLEGFASIYIQGS